MYISAPNNIAEILLKLTLNSNQSINHVYLDLFTLIILNLNDSSLYCAIRPIYNIHSISPPPQKKINTQIQPPPLHLTTKLMLNFKDNSLKMCQYLTF